MTNLQDFFNAVGQIASQIWNGLADIGFFGVNMRSIIITLFSIGLATTLARAFSKKGDN